MNFSRTFVVPAAGAGIVAVIALTGFAVTQSSGARAEVGADNGSSTLVEDFSYPGAAQIEQTQNVRLISGDGHLMMVTCSTPAEGDVGLIRVRTTETIGSGGNGLLCFKVNTVPARLDLEVPAVYEIRGDGLKSGAGHEGTAKISTDDGVKTTVELAPSASIQVGVGQDPDNEPTTLLQLTITG